MGLRNTYRHKVGPITINFTKKFSPSSVTFRAAGVTYRIWSKRDQSGFAGVDLPGPWSWRAKTKRKQAKAKQSQGNQVQENQTTSN
ncbi:MAG: DUF4236 domain-containing protein [Enterococcus sp.]|nr:DUF4236 domain-containing protein [Enterococcus sp.]